MFFSNDFYALYCNFVKKAP